MKNYTEQLIKQVLNAWAAQNKAVNAFFDKYEAGAYMKEVAPERNRAIYLLGHLIAIMTGYYRYWGLVKSFFHSLKQYLFPRPTKPLQKFPL